MNYNLNEYKQLKIKEVNYFLRGINFNNIGKKHEKIIDYASPECSSFFNVIGPCRLITEEFLIRIKEKYGDLIYVDLEFASSKEEVDAAIESFVNNIRKELDEYKYTVIKQTFIDKEKLEEDHVTINNHSKYNVKENNLINLGLNFIKIQIGDKIYGTPKNGKESEKEDVTLNNLNTMLIYVYALLGMINDKKEKEEEFIDFIAEHCKATDPKYFELRKLQAVFLNIKTYDDFIEKYNELIAQIKEIFVQEAEKIEESTPKPKAR